MWPETHSKSTAVERCFVRNVWKYTRKTQQPVLNIEKISSALVTKEVSIIYTSPDSDETKVMYKPNESIGSTRCASHKYLV